MRKRSNLILIIAVVQGLVISQLSSADSLLACNSMHTKAVTTCSAHEYAVNADALSIVSAETRQRVIRNEQSKLKSLKLTCLKIQKQCALRCDEEIENASIDGADLTAPLEKLNDCRQGEVARQLRAMDKKLVQLRRVLGPKAEPRQIIKSAANR